MVGLVVMTVATVMLNVATSIALFVVGRFLQGVSAAIVWAVGMALLVDTVPQGSLAQFLGYVSLGMTAGIMISPLLGGVLFDQAGYNAVYWLCYGIIAIDIAFRVLLVEKKHAKRWINTSDENESPEVGQEATSSADAISRSKEASGTEQNDSADKEKGEIKQSSELEMGQTQESNSGPENGEKQDSLPESEKGKAKESKSGSTAKSLEKKTRLSRLVARLPPIITLLASRRLLAVLFGALVQSALVCAFDTVLPLFVNEVFGWGALQAGILYFAIVIPTLLSPLVGWISDNYGPRWLASGGFLLTAPFLILLRLVDHNSLNQKVLLVALLCLIGVTLTMVFPPVMAEASHVVTAKEKKSPGIFGKGGAYAQSYALFNVAFSAGTLIGPLWAGFVKNAAGWDTMAWTLGLLSAVTAIPTAIYVGGDIWKKDKGEGDSAPETEASNTG